MPTPPPSHSDTSAVDGVCCASCADQNGVSHLHDKPGGCDGTGIDPPLASISCSIPLTDSEKLWRVVTASVKGFSIGAGLKGGLALFSILARLGRRRISASTRKSQLFSNREAVILDLMETLRYGLFLGTFAATFVSVDEIIAALGGHRRTAKWRYLLAGGVAGPSMLLTGPNTQRTSLAIYILMRAGVLASRCGIKSKKFGRICRPLTWKHWDIFLMCLSSSQILSAYILKLESVPPSYKSFLISQGAKDISILQGIKEIASSIPLTGLDAIEKHYKATGVDIKLDPDMKIPCSIIHGNQSCSGHVVSFLPQAYRRALRVYLPVYLVPALIIHRKRLMQRPFTILRQSLFGIARSSLFLSVYNSSAWAWTCLTFRIFNRCSVPVLALGTFPTGVALGIEKKSRRIEVSLYCLARAIESFFTWMVDVGYLPNSTTLHRVDVLVFSISTSIIMHCYALERQVFRSKYLNVLDWVFGVPQTPINKSAVA